ncbi:endolytic transglycosylase MltG [Candidatus Saccharibacteria bacterium]|nr:endolytic transglycosylase MltG [Candidatus Saccharibacteria bacterium]
MDLPKIKSRLRRYWIAGLVFLVIALFGLLSWYRLPVIDQEVVVEYGDSFDDVSAKLIDAGLARNRLVVKLVYKLKGSPELHQGQYLLNNRNGIDQMIDDLLVTPASLSITIPEGLRIDEQASRLVQISDSFLDFEDYLDNSELINKLPEQFGRIYSLEGFMFPDTYFLGVDQGSSQLVSLMIDHFNKIFDNELADQVLPDGLDWYQVLKLASVVEKEARTSQDKRLIAGVFLNRLRIGMKLDSDATINYQTKAVATSASDLKIDSPYNTYLYTGLPPTPISNPGLESILAVINPENNDYFYFLADPNGEVHYARTFEEHQANIVRVY